MLRWGAVKKTVRSPGQAGPDTRAPQAGPAGRRNKKQNTYKKDAYMNTQLNNGGDNIGITRYVLIVKKLRERPQY